MTKQEVKNMIQNHYESSDIGWMRKDFPTNIKGMSIPVNGIFSLIPTDKMRLVKMGSAETPFRRDDFKRVVMEQKVLGWTPFVWKDDGLKDPDGKFRFYPFVKKGFKFMSFLRDNLDCDLSDVFLPDKMIKISKYLSQPVDFRRSRSLRILILPKDLLYADGCGYAASRLFDNTGKVVKVVGLGKNSIYKGVILQDTPLWKILPKEVWDELRDRDLPDYDVVATTDTVKFSEPWTVQDFDMFYHDDSSRNHHVSATVSEQLIRVAPTTNMFKNWCWKQLCERHREVNIAMSDRGVGLGKFLKGISQDQDFAPDDPSLNAVLSDVSNLLVAGVPFAFKRIWINVAKGIQSIIRNRTLNSLKHPGAFAFVVANQRLHRGEVAVPSLMRKMNLKVGDNVTIWRSPISPTSVRSYVIKRFIPDYHIEMRSEDLNEYHQGDTDGDKIAVIPGNILTENREPVTVDSSRFTQMIAEYTEEMPNGNEFVQMMNEIEVVALSKAVGFAERIRAGLEITKGMRSWTSAYGFFQSVEQGLIDMKKHSGGLWHALDMCLHMLKNRLLPNRPNFHKLLANRKNMRPLKEYENETEYTNIIRTIDQISKQLLNPDFDKSNHESRFLYEKGYDIASDIFKGLNHIKNDDRKKLNEFKMKMKMNVQNIIQTGDTNRILKYLCDRNCRPTGILKVKHRRMGAFWASKPSSQQRKEFKAMEGNEFDTLKGNDRKVVLGVSLANEIYGWIQHFELSEIHEFIGEATKQSGR